MKIKCGSVIVLMLAFVCEPVLSQMGGGGVKPDIAAEPKWPSLGGGFRRTGQSSDLGPLSGGVLWKFETGGAVVGSVTVGSAGRIHVACEDGKLYTLDSSGSPLWVLDVNSPLLSAPSIGPDGSLYVGGRSGKVYAVTSDGRLLWTFDTGNPVYSSPAVGADAVYVGSSDGTLYALRISDGTELWAFETNGRAIFASPSIGVDGTIYVAGLYAPMLYALNPVDGSTKWMCRFPPTTDGSDTGGWPFTSPVVAADGTIYQTLLYDPNLYAIEPSNGAFRWSVNLCDPNVFGRGATAPKASDGWSEPVVAPDGTIYVCLNDPYVRAVDPGGSLKWVTRVENLPDDPFGLVGFWPDLTGMLPAPTVAEDAGGFTLTVDSSGLVYAASENGQVYVIAPGSLTVAEFETGGWPGFPVIAADDLLILADSKDYSSLEESVKNTVWAISKLPAPTR